MTVTLNLRAAGATVALSLVVAFCGAAWSQQPPAPVPLPPDQMLTPDQLDDLVAPVALYPDPLLSQLLVLDQLLAVAPVQVYVFGVTRSSSASSVSCCRRRMRLEPLLGAAG